MPACLANSDVLSFTMPLSFAHHEHNIKQKVRTLGNDFVFAFPHNTNMAIRRGIPKQGATWFIREWMDYFGIKQARMMDMTGWSKASTSQIYNGKQDFNPKIVKEAAIALNLESYELMMPPEKAMALRRLQATAETIVQIAHDNIERDGTNG